jgi:hypothetical protein
MKIPLYETEFDGLLTLWAFNSDYHLVFRATMEVEIHFAISPIIILYSK